MTRTRVVLAAVLVAVAVVAWVAGRGRRVAREPAVASTPIAEASTALAEVGPELASGPRPEMPAPPRPEDPLEGPRGTRRPADPEALAQDPPWKRAAASGQWEAAMRALEGEIAETTEASDRPTAAIRRRLEDLLAYATARHATPEEAVPHVAAWLVGVTRDLDAPADTAAERTALAGLDPGEQTSVWTARGAGDVDTLFYRLLFASNQLEWTGRPWAEGEHPTDRLERAVREGTRTLPAGSASRALGEGTTEFLEIGRAFYPAIDSTTERIVARILPRVRAFGERYATSNDPHLREMARWLTARYARWLASPAPGARSEEGSR